MFHRHEWETIHADTGWYQHVTLMRPQAPEIMTRVVQRCQKCGEIEERHLTGAVPRESIMCVQSARRGTE